MEKTSRWETWIGISGPGCSHDPSLLPGRRGTEGHLASAVCCTGLLRAALLEEYGKRLEDMRIVRNAWGKPMVYGEDAIQFSISHGVDGAAVSLSRSRTGIDMEMVRPFCTRTADRVLSLEELRFVHSSSQEERDFFRLWTLKESYVKVLGFYNGEVSAYVYRENIILSIIGAAAGLLLGINLHRVIMTSIEQDVIMFGNYIEGRSFFYAFIITLIFSVLVNLFLYRRLKNIPMVESLKSVE